LAWHTPPWHTSNDNSITENDSTVVISADKLGTKAPGGERNMMQHARLLALVCKGCGVELRIYDPLVSAPYMAAATSELVAITPPA
jgi:hypothetical protein